VTKVLNNTKTQELLQTESSMKDFKPLGAEILPEGFITVTGTIPLISYYIFDTVFVEPS